MNLLQRRIICFRLSATPRVRSPVDFNPTRLHQSCRKGEGAHAREEAICNRHAPLAEGIEARMRDLFDVRLNETDTPMDAMRLRAPSPRRRCWCRQ